jgi:hypothetical protein
MTSTVVNSKTCEISEPGASLLAFLQSDLCLTRVKPGCGAGARTVIMNDVPVLACQLRAGDANLTGHLRAHPVDGEGWQRAVSSETGDAEAALAAAATQVRATHTTAYLAHVPLEPGGGIPAGSPAPDGGDRRARGLRRCGLGDRVGFPDINTGANGFAFPHAVPNRRLRYQPTDSLHSQGPYRALSVTAGSPSPALRRTKSWPTGTSSPSTCLLTSGGLPTR